MLVRDKANNSLIDTKTVIDDNERWNLSGSTIRAFKAVNFYLHSSGKFAMRLADTSVTGYYVDGFTVADIDTGLQGTVRVLGPLSGFPVLLADEYYSDNANPGKVTSTAPGTGISQFVGKRWDSTTLYVNPQRGGGGGGGVSTASLPLSISGSNITLGVTVANNGGAVALQGVTPTAQAGTISVNQVSGQHGIISSNGSYRALSATNNSTFNPAIYAQNTGTENAIEAAAVDGFAIKASINPAVTITGHMYLVPYSFGLPPSPVNGTIHSDTNGELWVYSKGAWTQVTARGTSFPGSPATGQHFYRTDRNIEYFYDGTRWLSVGLYVPSVQYDPAVPRPGIAAGMPYSPYFLVSCFHPLYGVYVESVTVPTYHLTTLNSSNYASWNVRDDNGGGTTVSMSGWLVGRVANTTYYLTGTINTYYSGGVSYYIELVKTGTPGNVYTYPPTLIARLVG